MIIFSLFNITVSEKSRISNDNTVVSNNCLNDA